MQRLGTADADEKDPKLHHRRGKVPQMIQGRQKWMSCARTLHHLLGTPAELTKLAAKVHQLESPAVTFKNLSLSLMKLRDKLSLNEQDHFHQVKKLRRAKWVKVMNDTFHYKLQHVQRREEEEKLVHRDRGVVVGEAWPPFTWIYRHLEPHSTTSWKRFPRSNVWNFTR